MELTIGTLLQATKGKTIILVTDIGDHWITYKPIYHHLDSIFSLEMVNKVQIEDVLSLLRNKQWEIIG